MSLRLNAMLNHVALPSQDVAKPPPPLLRIPYRYIVVATSLVPALALITCGAVGAYLHFEQIVHTHCNVHNFLPSISAIISHFPPEKYYWRIATALVAVPRLLDSYLYYRFFKKKSILLSGLSGKLFKWVNSFNCFFHFAQYSSLLMVTYVGGRENWWIHNNSFFVFLTFCGLHMLSFLYLYSKVNFESNSKQEFTLRWRKRCTALYLLAVVGIAYFCERHNTYCEPNIYSYLALCEYVVGVTYTTFHVMQALDFQNLYLSVGI